MKILIVEDDSQIRRGLQRLLQDSHNEVVPAGSKIEAIGFMRQSWKPELVITDLDMGKGTDGLELITEMHPKDLRIRFWLMSSGMTDDVAMIAQEAGAERALAKSYLIEALIGAGIVTSITEPE